MLRRMWCWSVVAMRRQRSSTACAAPASRAALTLLSDEPVPPYHRPPLSKKYLSDSLPVEQIFIRAAAWYAEQKVELRLGARVARIERERGRVRSTTASASATTSWCC